MNDAVVMQLMILLPQSAETVKRKNSVPKVCTYTVPALTFVVH